MKINSFQAIIKYKFIDILFWAIIIVFATIDLGVHHGKSFTFLQNLINTIAAKTGNIVSVYIILYLLKPKLLIKKKYALFFLTSLLVILSINFLGFYFQQLIFSIINNTDKELRFLVIYLSNIIDTLLYTALILSASVLYDYNAEKIKNEVLQKEKLQAELDFLKGQMNPHFLFNAINSIFVLINEDKELARKHLHTFSEMLRYQLYDCKAEYICLKDEIEFIKHYLSLERLRKSAKTAMNFTITTLQLQHNIIPFVLINFVENACKHIAENNVNEKFIDIKLEDANDKLLFTCKNTVAVNPRNVASNNNGIGLANTLRRLALIYPNHHTIQILTDDKYYCITLEIKL